MGFGDKCCAWIKACFSSASLLVLVNGSPTSEFVMERGLRQGDPISLPVPCSCRGFEHPNGKSQRCKSYQMNFHGPER